MRAIQNNALHFSWYIIKLVLSSLSLLSHTISLKATAQGHEPVVYLLLDHGADPSVANAAGYTPLLMAVSESKQSVIQLLLAKGKNKPEWIDTKDSLDSTPLLLAIRQGLVLACCWDCFIFYFILFYF